METLWRRVFRGAIRLRQRPDWPHFAGRDWPEHIMDAAVTDRFHAKQGRSTGRWVLHANGRRLAVYLKRHYRLPWWQGLLAALLPEKGWSPALQEWRHLHWAQKHGVPVPEAVAAGEFIGPWGRLQSVLAIEELTGMIPLNEAVPLAAARLDAADFARWKRSLIGELGRLVRHLHHHRRFHKDLYLCHFYVPAVDANHVPEWNGRVHLIDLHRLKHHPWTWRFWRIKDLAQLLYSSDVGGVTARDRLRFWHCYLQPTAPVRARGLAWLIRLRWWNYCRHNRRSDVKKVRGKWA